MQRVILPLVLIILAVSTVGSANATIRDRGFYLSLGSVGVHFDLEDAARADLAEAGVALGSNGNGGELLAGYRFGKYVSLGVRITGTELDTGHRDVDGGLGMFVFEVKGHLRPGQAIQPYVTGGTGGAAIFLDGGGFDGEDALEASLMNLGTGVDVNFAKHWTVSFDYRTSVMDFDRTVIPVDYRPHVAFDGSGFAHLMGFRATYRF